jgi:cytoskeletal protein CcmA (bactofilin family)
MMNKIAKRAKSMLDHLARGESGYATLTAVLILLILGALITTSLLVFTDTGLKAGQTHERRTAELYAADAGVDYALWQIKMGQVPTSGGVESFPQFTVNDKTVNVWIYDVTPQGGAESNYKIRSVATTNSDSSTTVESYISVSYSTIDLLKGAITSYDDVEIDNPVTGDVVCGGDLSIKADVTGNVLCAGTVHIFSGVTITGNVTYGQSLIRDNNTTVTGTITHTPGLQIPVVQNWPSADVFKDFYGGQVNKNNPFPYASIDPASTPSIGPLYRAGSLDIETNSQNTPTLTLNGTVYVTDQLTMGTSKKPFTLNLNGKAIFCEYQGTGNAITIGSNCTIQGPGYIIGVGDVNFGPKQLVGEGNPYVIIMSVQGTTTVHPQANFYGAVIGKVDVSTLGDKGILVWKFPDSGTIEFPSYNTAKVNTYNIYNYYKSASP